MVGPYAGIDPSATIKPAELAERLRRCIEHRGSSPAPGAIKTMEDSEVRELAALLETGVTPASIDRMYIPYGDNLTDVMERRRRKTETIRREIAILLRGVVEVRSPFASTGEKAGTGETWFPVTIIQPPALIGLFEAVPQTGTPNPRVQISAGVQSFVVARNLSQRGAWRPIFNRGTTGLPRRAFEKSGEQKKYGELFNWKDRSKPHPSFSEIAHDRQTKWMVEVAFLTVDGILAAGLEDLNEHERSLRDLLYRVALRQFGSSLIRHTPGYRPNRDGAGFLSLVEELDSGQQPHHTCCLTFKEANELLPVETVCLNVFDYISREQDGISLAEYLPPRRRGANDPLPTEVSTKFFESYLSRILLMPAFSRHQHPCFYSSRLWPLEDSNWLLEKIEGNAEQVWQDIDSKGLPIRDLTINSRPAVFGDVRDEKGAPDTIAQLLYRRSISFAKQ